ncbi:MAG: sulfotransferase [Anaerolineales bacterium]|nr:sulfotransferase [Anaerolineales bacterium]
MAKRLRVLYIMGWGRSGSTILANILGQIEGFLSVGEIRSIWDYGYSGNNPCGCGRPFHACGFWNRVLEEFYREAGPIRAERWNRICRAETRTLSGLKHFLPAFLVRHSSAAREYLSVTRGLYSALQKAGGCRVIVDSSKFPFYGNLLGWIPDIKVFLLHLIRDPRAAAFSWSHPKPQPGSPMRRIGALESAILWDIWNLSAEGFCRRAPERHLRVRYEDFLTDPQGTIGKIVRLVGESPGSLPFVADRSVLLKENHTLMGNPTRFQTGRIELSEDLRWKTGLSRRDRRITECITGVLSRRYGYLDRPAAPSLEANGVEKTRGG